MYIHRLTVGSSSDTAIPPVTTDRPNHSEGGHLETYQQRSLFFALLISVGRLPVGAITGVAVAIILLLHSTLPFWLIIVHALPICAITMAGFSINDITDVGKDSYSNHYKPLVVGVVSLRQAGCFALIMAAGGVILAAVLAHNSSLFIIVGTLLGVSAYSCCAQKIPILKNIATALLCCTPFAYGAEVAEIAFPLPLYVFLLLFITGRELLLDVRDYAGDMKAGVRTLVAYLQPGPSCWIGWALMASSLSMVILYATGLAQILFATALLSLALCLVVYLRNESNGLAWSRVTLLTGTVASAFCLEA